VARKKPNSIKQVLTASNTDLNRLLGQAKGLDTLNTRLAKILPVPLSHHCAAAGIHQHDLVLIVDSPAWATKIRLMLPLIKKRLGDLGVESLTLKIQPVSLPSQAPLRGRPSMSKNTSNLLIELAEITSDCKLKNALRRLSRHASK
jgi:hypothetical protein